MTRVQDGEGEIHLEKEEKCPVNPEKEGGLYPRKDFKKQRENLCLYFEVHPAHGATAFKLR